MFNAVRPLLFALEPERAHGLAVAGLKAAQAFGLLGAVRRLHAAPAAPVEVAGLKFPNPVGLAAGFDKNAELVEAMAALGFGFIEVGTLTRHPQMGNAKPRVFRYPEYGALVNRLGFNNCGIEQGLRNLEGVARTVPIGINIGKSWATALEDAPREYAECAAMAYPMADYLVLNISSPNTAELRRLFEPDRLKALLEAVRTVMERSGRKPLFLKVSPDSPPEELANAARVAVETGTGLVATNTTVDRAAHPGWEPGGLSGRPLKNRANEILRSLRELTGGKVPLIGVGGIFGTADARQRFEAGADLIQLYTGFVYRGPEIIREIVADLATREPALPPGPLPINGRGS